jgi:hypothetical protein
MRSREPDWVAVWVPIIHPYWSGSMPILAEGAAEPVPPADIEVHDLLRIVIGPGSGRRGAAARRVRWGRCSL